MVILRNFPVNPSISREFPVFPRNSQYFPPSWENCVFPAFLPTVSEELNVKLCHNYHKRYGRTYV